MSDAEVHKLATALRHATLASFRLRATLAAQLHINVTELNALGYLAELDTLTPKDLSTLLRITTASVTALIDRLEAAGLVFRQPNPADRRSTLLRLTPGGDHASQWVDEQFAEAMTKALDNGRATITPQVAAFLEQATDELNHAAGAADTA